MFTILRRYENMKYFIVNIFYKQLPFKLVFEFFE